MVKQNVGLLDRATRIILGIFIIGMRYFLKVGGVLGDGVVLLGALWIWEGILGYCLLYGILRWSTRRRDSN